MRSRPSDGGLLSCLTLSAYGAVPTSISWMAANTVEPHRSIAIALQVRSNPHDPLYLQLTHIPVNKQIATGGLGGLCGSFLYLDSEAPQYPTGYYTSMAVAFVGIASCVVLKIGYTRVNRKRNELTREEIESNWNEEKL